VICPGRIDRGVFEDLGHGGRRHGKNSVRSADPAAADIERRAENTSHAQDFGEIRASDDIDERVVGSGLVEMDRPELFAVDLGFGLEESSENGQGVGLDRVGERAFADNLFDIAPVPWGGFFPLPYPDVHLDPPQTGPFHGTYADVHGKMKGG
jgi:hypothetical protein